MSDSPEAQRKALIDALALLIEEHLHGEPKELVDVIALLGEHDVELEASATDELTDAHQIAIHRLIESGAITEADLHEHGTIDAEQFEEIRNRFLETQPIELELIVLGITYTEVFERVLEREQERQQGRRQP